MKKILYTLLLIIFVLCIDKINAYTEYKVGDVVPYNGIDFYVIKDSSSREDSVTMLKAEPLTVDEVNLYGVGHINRYGYSDVGIVKNLGGYGGVAYYTSDGCYSTNPYGGSENSKCLSEYEKSDIKYIVDTWANDNFANDELIEEKTYKARLLTLTEVLSFKYGNKTETSCGPNCHQMYYPITDDVPAWLYLNNFYWTMTSETSSEVWRVNSNGIYSHSIHLFNSLIRPVITLKKTALGDEDESIVDDNIEKEDSKLDAKDNIDDNKSNESKTIVKVANTYMSSSIIIIILGFIIASISVFVLYKFRNKSKNN